MTSDDEIISDSEVCEMNTPRLWELVSLIGALAGKKKEPFLSVDVAKHECRCSDRECRSRQSHVVGRVLLAYLPLGILYA